MRPNPDAVARDRRGNVRHLNRRHAHGTLPDPREPRRGLALRAFVRIGHITGRFGNPKPKFLTEPEAPHPVTFAFNPQPIANGFEEHVAAALERI
jgi:hypothetical protein